MLNNIINVTYLGLFIDGDDRIAEFLAKAPEMLLVCYLQRNADVPAYLENAAKNSVISIRNEQSLEMKCLLFDRFLGLDVRLPFRAIFDARGKRLCIKPHDTWLVVADDDQVVDMLKALAPYMRKGAYLGFIDGNANIWSYAFDGNGSFDRKEHIIKWGYDPDYATALGMKRCDQCGFYREDGVCSAHGIKMSPAGEPCDKFRLNACR